MTDRHSLVDDVDGYRFKPHELPILPGSPANPDHPAGRRAAYLGIGILLGLIGGAQNGFLIANSPALRAGFALTPVEEGWLTVAFYSTYACMSMLLFRVRQEFGVQPFVRWAMAGVVAANFVQMMGPGYYPELAARAVAHSWQCSTRKPAAPCRASSSFPASSLWRRSLRMTSAHSSPISSVLSQMSFCLRLQMP